MEEIATIILIWMVMFMRIILKIIPIDFDIECQRKYMFEIMVIKVVFINFAVLFLRLWWLTDQQSQYVSNRPIEDMYLSSMIFSFFLNIGVD
jgi:hypothetical protein